MPLPLLPLALSGASFLGGLFGGNKGPRLDKAYSPLQAALIPMIQKRLTASTDDIKNRTIGNINSVYRNVQTGLENNLTSRGLATSPIAGNAYAHLQAARAGDIVRQVPEAIQQQQQAAIQQAMQALSIGYGNAVQGPSAVGSGISNLASMLGFLYGNGAFNRKPANSASPDSVWGPMNV